MGMDLAEEIGFAQEKRQHREALLSLGTVRPQVAPGSADPHIAQVRTNACRPALEVVAEAVLERFLRDAASFVRETGLLETQVAGPRREPRSERFDQLTPGRVQLTAKTSHCNGPRLD